MDLPRDRAFPISQSAPGQLGDNPRPANPTLDRLLSAAPLGLDIVDGDGRKVFSCSGVDAQEPDTRTERYDVLVDGRSYSLSLTLDDRERRQRENELLQRAYFDELTGLPNRSLFERSVSALIATGPEDFALAFVDIDGFKHVNDYYGHDTGDRLLARIAERLGNGLRRSDMLARLSGDEFVLLISPLGDFEDLKRDLGWISERLKEPFFVDGHEIFSSASIGVSVYPRDGRCYETLRGNADLAMYDGKVRCKGTVRYYDRSIQHVADERSRLEQRLRLAIRDKRVCCAYQPKVDLRSGDTMGVEVLMRWRDEDGIIQAPGDFVGLAVELGLIDDLTHFILAETVASVDAINDNFGPSATISINVAARQAADTRFMGSFVEALDATGFASRFTIEITEEAFLSHSEFQSRILPMIRKVGAKVSIDDFGVGFSSLSALADITADELKIDRSFITDIHRRPRNQSILKAMEALGHSLGMTIVVEGVETFEEVAYLQAATRINIAQGYYFAKPMLLERSAGDGVVDTGRSAQPIRGVEPSRHLSLRA
jgi:diguanylate cyclase (GGDEF)-like protein